MKIYTIRNNVLNYSNRPFYFESDEEAKQYVLNVLCSDADRALSNLRECLDLYCIGEIDFSAGIITNTCSDFICPLSDIWAYVPQDKVPRDSVELRKEIIELKELFVKLEGSYNSICDTIKKSSFLSKIINLFRKEKK